MSEGVVLAEEKGNGRFRRFLTHLRNPVTVKELRGRMRGRRAFVVLTIYLIVMSAFITLIYLAFSANSGPTGPDTRDMGRVIFSTVVGVQTFLVLFIGPAFTAGSISGEKERQTYDLLRTTLLSAPALVTGKLLSALSYVGLLIFAAIPVQSIAFLLGGVTFIELFLSLLILMVAAVTVGIYGTYCSTVMRSTLGASVVTFAGILLLTFGIPLVVGLFTAILGPVIGNAFTTNPLLEVLLAYGLLVIAATNLPATLIVSDVFLLQEDAIFYFTTSFGSRSAYVFSPWPLFLLIYALIALLLYWLTVRRVRRIANK